MWVNEASLRYQKRRRKFDDSHRFKINSMRFQPQGKLAVTHNLIHFYSPLAQFLNVRLNTWCKITMKMISAQLTRNLHNRHSDISPPCRISQCAFKYFGSLFTKSKTKDPVAFPLKGKKIYTTITKQTPLLEPSPRSLNNS